MSTFENTEGQGADEEDTTKGRGESWVIIFTLPLYCYKAENVVKHDDN